MSAPASPCAPESHRPSRWRDGMLWLLGGIVAMVVGGNAVMIWIALQAQPHLVRTDYYEASKRVDSERALRVEGARLGWQVSAIPEPSRQGALALRISDSDGRPVRGLEGTLAAYRPSDAALDQTLPVMEDPSAPGLYRAEFQQPVAGLWRLTVDLARQEQRLVQELRVVMP